MRVLAVWLLWMPAVAVAAPCASAQVRAERAWEKAASALDSVASRRAARSTRLRGAARVDGSSDAQIYLDQADLEDAAVASLTDAMTLAREAASVAGGDAIPAMQAAMTAFAAHADLADPAWARARLASEVAFSVCAPPGTPIPAALPHTVAKPGAAPVKAPPADEGPVSPPEVSAWIERPDGLATADLVVGAGDVATNGQIVTVDYAGWLADGARFDSSYARKAPLKIKLGANLVIPGWELGLMGMRVGGKRIIRIPPSLGYGDRAIGPIPAGSTLIFQVELRGVAAPRVPPEAPEPLSDADYSSTPSGLLVHDFVVGDGPAPKTGDRVVVEYTGWLSNGQRFDSSLSREEAFDFRVGLGEVIKGWDEALLGMRAGGRRQVRIPAALGYGSRGAPPMIPPGATLVFDIRLLSVQAK
jgi:peptidylprolyl isomerase